MLDSLRYLVRLIAAVILIGVAGMFAIIATTDAKSRTLLFSMAGVFGFAAMFTWPRRPNAWRNDKPTERQLAFARDLGIAIPRRITKGELSDMIDQAKQIRDAF
jgi:hypothetical protein